ncbi:hypothetical protein EHQ53_04850 [Leptospira langatensis]|uniref:30S ribosomal protein S1 n=1 Tax=Leptospira langatensis TaxID=2484983 RepID=A0A5F1ZYG3_9LEPT|nr:hypothetical protein [Leptospira langatensis]TGK00145.1 hypothetical protein EHO57_12710 [Leptospira langatensis]TGL42780.1 hypothetical protein EHQ53_04850 [Leptospira langatensis]
MRKEILLFLLSIFLSSSSLLSTEVLLKNGDAFLAEEVLETQNDISFSWKDQKYRIPKSEIQRIDPRKKGLDSSYKYAEFVLSDGTILRGILVEKKGSKLVLKTELGFAELDKSKIVSEPSEDLQTSPTLPDKYLDATQINRNWRMGLSGFGLASLGAWSKAFPLVYGGGFYLERNAKTSGWFYGFSSEYSSGPGNTGRLSLWSQNAYIGSTYGHSSPYWLLGAGASSITRSQGEDRTSALTPDLLLEFGWSWDISQRHQIRIGLRSQCHIQTEASLCNSGVRFSWGFYI